MPVWTSGSKAGFSTDRLHSITIARKDPFSHWTTSKNMLGAVNFFL